MTKVSIIIVARNEESVIAASVAAARRAANEIGGAELILADSASTDLTVEIALTMHVKVLRLKPHWELSASAGRFIGAHYAAGEYLLFIDADTLVYENFLPQAIEKMEANADLGGVCGFLDDANEQTGELLVFEDRCETAASVKWLRGGCCLYRRSAISAVGFFNPYLHAEEEADIGLRLTKAGWRLAMLPVPMAVHTRCTEDASAKSLMTHLRRTIFSGRFGGTARTAGYAFKNGYGLEFCRLRMPTAIIFAAWCLLIAVCAAAPFAHSRIIALTIFAAGFALIGWKKKSVGKTLVFFAAKAAYLINLLLGVTKISFKPASAYPLDVEILENTEIINVSRPDQPTSYAIVPFANQPETAFKI